MTDGNSNQNSSSGNNSNDASEWSTPTATVKSPPPEPALYTSVQVPADVMPALSANDPLNKLFDKIATDNVESPSPLPPITPAVQNPSAVAAVLSASVSDMVSVPPSVPVTDLPITDVELPSPIISPLSPLSPLSPPSPPSVPTIDVPLDIDVDLPDPVIATPPAPPIEEGLANPTAANLGLGWVDDLPINALPGVPATPASSSSIRGFKQMFIPNPEQVLAQIQAIEATLVVPMELDDDALAVDQDQFTEEIEFDSATDIQVDLQTIDPDTKSTASQSARSISISLAILAIAIALFVGVAIGPTLHSVVLPDAEHIDPPRVIDDTQALQDALAETAGRENGEVETEDVLGAAVDDAATDDEEGENLLLGSDNDTLNLLEPGTETTTHTNTNTNTKVINNIENKAADHQRLKKITKMLRRASRYFENDDTDAAITLYLKVLELDAENIRAHTALGEVYISEDELNSAKKHLEKALSINDRFPQAHFFMGALYEEVDKEKKALRHYRRYLRLAPRGKFSDDTKDIIEALE